MKLKRILVAVDGSTHSERVVAVAGEYSRLFGAELLMVHCHPRFTTILGEPCQDEVIARIIRQAEELVAPYLAQLRIQDLEAEIRLLEEPAGDAIIDVAKIERCDLIIMGSRGLGKLAGLLVGSVTTRVLQIAHCSVLVVR